LEVLEFACGIPHLLKGGFLPRVSSSVDSYDLREPLGVAAGITPFNFPAMVPMWMAPMAIACGNAFVLKPSPRDPSAANWIAERFAEAGLPAGVLQVVHGDREAVDGLLEHPDVAAVSFVGSTPVARHINATATATGKRVQALGGAKNHMVVLPDADLDAAADAAVSAGYGSAGERCMAISAVVAVGGIADELVAKIAERARKLTVGAGTNPDAEMGPLITQAHRDRVASYLDPAVTEGAELVVDGRGHPVASENADPEHGYWLGPSLLDRVATTHTAYRDEIFGPVLSVLRATDYDEAMATVNGNPYGNGAAVFTRDGGAARRFRDDVEAGMVGVNVPIPVPMAYFPFGGRKDSLYGSLNVHGTEGVAFYTQNKVVSERWPRPEESSLDLGFPTSD